MAVTVCHLFIGLLYCRVKADRVVDLVMYGKRYSRARAVTAGTAGTAGVNEMLYFAMPARLKHIAESDQIGLRVA